MKEIYGLSRSRDKKGNVVSRNLNPYVNCIHSQVGGARDNMEVYLIEIEYEDKDSWILLEEPDERSCL